MNNFGATSPIQSSDSCYQMITINLNQLFLPETQTFLGQQAEVYIFDNRERSQIYGSDSHDETAGQLYQEMQAGYDNKGIPLKIKDANHKVFTVLSRSLSDPDITVILLFSPYHLTVQGYFSELISIAAITLLFFLLLLILLRFYSNYRQRLDYITGTMDNFNEQKPDDHRPLLGNDEIARIDRHLIRMQNRILALIQEKYAVKMQKISAQLEALAVCVNPHFLYNTLNSISSMACMEGAERSVEMISALSGMFRYSCDTTEKFVSLQTEMQNISDYLYIQKIRYQDNLVCQIQIPEEYCNIRVPKLILQPIVENAFKHGFQTSPSQNKELLITSGIKGEALYLRIRDNGCGISADTLEKLQTELKQDEFVGESVRIGLFNVNSRIRLLCGSEYGVTVTSEEGSFTLVELSLPGKISDTLAALPDR